ncbi:PTS transporter subunit EIIB [Agathobaculum sp. LCP25S3_E8]|uniref:PTS transporter subunit EIIB n=1 Tax=Agathobaculum sp. LCP25S3_E8 TaxID=3438735 RepID=UPI003F92F63F
MLDAIGGRDNVISVEYCMTRLRLHLREAAAADEAKLRAAGAAGVLHWADGEVHVIIGPLARSLAREMETLVK